MGCGRAGSSPHYQLDCRLAEKMTDSAGLQPLIDIVQQVGILGVVLFMYYQERQASIFWREQYMNLMDRVLHQSLG